MTVSSANRTAIFIDGANLHSTTKVLGFDIDSSKGISELMASPWLPKPAKEFIDANGNGKLNSNMDINAMKLLTASITSGFSPAAEIFEAVQRRGVRVIVISTISSQPSMIADEPRRRADEFADLADLQSRIGRGPIERVILVKKGATRLGASRFDGLPIQTISRQPSIKARSTLSRMSFFTTIQTRGGKVDDR
jgi:uncharacterized LabA/DUF88 family protein